MAERRERPHQARRQKVSEADLKVARLLIAGAIMRPLLDEKERLPRGVPGITPEEQAWWRKLVTQSEAVLDWAVKGEESKNG